MGATASRASPSLPAKCGLFKTKQSETCLFTVPEYSKWARMPAGRSLMFAPILADEMNIEYRLIVYPGGFHAESADFIAVFIFAGAQGETFKYMPEGTCTISFEILDETGHRTVFDNHTAASEQTLELQNSCKGYVCYYHCPHAISRLASGVQAHIQ
jgi:hypothetical protein